MNPRGGAARPRAGAVRPAFVDMTGTRQKQTIPKLYMVANRLNATCGSILA